MEEEILFPSYISRTEEERQIGEKVAQVREDGKSRAVLLYGPGGVGKTRLVRQLVQANAADPSTVWLDPVDIDDSEYWLLSNLERLVAGRLDPENRYFGPYRRYLSRLPTYAQARVGHETVVSHLGRVKRVFGECYSKLVEESESLEGGRKTIVIVFDTMEAIRGMYLLVTLTQWMKALPATLFILSCRPMIGPGDREDPIKVQLEDPYERLPVSTISIGEFTAEAALDYLNRSGVGSALDVDEKAKLVRLTRGHPLWLAFTVAYLDEYGIPPEAERPLAEIEREIPFRGELPAAGRIWHEGFKRRLVSHYRDTDFRHEAVKRLAVLRESVNEGVWRELMGDRFGPADLQDPEIIHAAWTTLLRTPWIRPRANRHYVTLHDAVAEELAQRIIPLHDQGEQWRRRLWQDAARIYGEMADRRETELAGGLADLDEKLKTWYEDQGSGAESPPKEEESQVIEVAAELDAQRHELSQLKAVHLYYETLCHPETGCRRFLQFFDQAKDEHDILSQNLLALEIQRFLPEGVDAYALGDVVGEEVRKIRDWLSSDGREIHLEIGLSMADYLIRNEQPQAAFDLLAALPAASADRQQRYRLNNLLGNACMRIPGSVKDGLGHFMRALEDARRVSFPEQANLVAAAYKELGFYYRNEGLWEKADDAYRQARDVISGSLLTDSSDENREQMASIQTNWAYLMGLGGNHRDGTNLVESAITVRHRLKNYHEEATSWSACGEVYRYEGRFEKAWDAYAQAEQIFHGQRNWSWLGLIYQEQAICLFQAAQDDINLTPARDPIDQAKRLITLALDLCSDLAVRGYPSALNRAGRIFGQDDPDAGLDYLAQGIDSARTLSDGWFWFANLIEYVELSYRMWVKTRKRVYRDMIGRRGAEIAQVMEVYEFSDLIGRWNLLQGHLLVHDFLDTKVADEDELSAALQHYKDGFAQIAARYVGSSGAAAIPGEFKKFRDLIMLLSPEIRSQWREELRRSWTGLEHGSTLLLARLEELY